MLNKKFSIMLLCVLALAAFLNGCGASNKEGSATLGEVAKVGDTACFQCHSATSDPLTGESIVTQYTRSAHYTGGQGCESCHGGGAQHNGVGPFPFPKPDAARCATCHDGKTAPLTSSTNFATSNHAVAYGAAEATLAKCNRCHSHEGAVLSNPTGFTGDASIINNTAYQPVLSRDPATFGNIRCATCHEHGGALRAAKTRDANGNIVAWDPNKNFKNDQFDLCTSCHTLLTSSGKLVGSGDTLAIAKPAGGFQNISTASFFHDTSWFRTIATTHYDQPDSSTAAAGGTTIEGYVIRKDSANPCFDCHGHEFKTNTRKDFDKSDRPSTTYTDWAKSAHAGQLLQVKNDVALANGGTTRSKAQVDAVMTAGVTDATGPGWSRYDWDNTTTRGSCQRCHTATGASNFMKNPAKFDSDGKAVSGSYDLTGAGNSFTHLAGWSTTNKKSGQNELLYCWGCHSNAGKGVLNNPGPFSFWFGNDKTNADPNGVLITYPDVSSSNVCLTCHSGRNQIAANIKNDNQDGTNVSFINPHYMPSASIVFAKGGYEFSGTGRDYAAPSFFAHDKIGTSAAANTGTSGPCVACHMSSPNKHLFSNVTKDNTGTITAITSTMCATCHTGAFALTAAKLEEEKLGYEATLEALKQALIAKGIFYNPAGVSGQYFFTSNTWATAYKTWATPYGSASWKDTMGAAYNLHILTKDAGFAHNRFYSKRLLWDAIDFIYDGTLNNDVAAAIDAQVTAGRLVQATADSAKAYLGTTRP